jgi:hypothetical protein
MSSGSCVILGSAKSISLQIGEVYLALADLRTVSTRRGDGDAIVGNLQSLPPRAYSPRLDGKVASLVSSV